MIVILDPISYLQSISFILLIFSYTFFGSMLWELNISFYFHSVLVLWWLSFCFFSLFFLISPTTSWSFYEMLNIFFVNLIHDGIMSGCVFSLIPSLMLRRCSSFFHSRLKRAAHLKCYNSSIKNVLHFFFCSSSLHISTLMWDRILFGCGEWMMMREMSTTLNRFHSFTMDLLLLCRYDNEILLFFFTLKSVIWTEATHWNSKQTSVRSHTHTQNVIRKIPMSHQKIIRVLCCMW